MKTRIISLFFIGTLLSCSASENDALVTELHSNSDSVIVKIETPPLFCNESIKVGAENTVNYFPQIKGKKIGVIANQSSMINDTHLVDSLKNAGFDLVRVFSPEHGFRGKADAGEKVKDEIDDKTGLQIVSLYGNNKKPNKDQLTGIEVLLFDLQDVGVRFYTYISTLHYVMEACAENGIELIVLDRPNPNGHYIDGPVLDPAYKSFVGMHKVPVIHGMTIGEYGQMVNEEGWLSNNVRCKMSVVKCTGYDHTKHYKLPKSPSPNLPNMTSIYLYPSLCFFEGTIVSIGRGTDSPFQIIGHPDYASDSTDYSFVPQPNIGAKNPKLNGQECHGLNFVDVALSDLQKNDQLDLSYLYAFYDNLNAGESFFLKNNFIDLLYGSNHLRKSMLQGESFEELRQTWSTGLQEFKILRKKYLLYQDFE